MSALVFASSATPFLPSAGVFSVATALREEGIDTTVIQHTLRMSLAQCKEVFEHLAVPDVKAVVFHGTTEMLSHDGAISESDVAALEARVKLARGIFPKTTKFILAGGLFKDFRQQVLARFECYVDAVQPEPYGFDADIRQAHGVPEPLEAERQPDGFTRKRVDWWPRDLMQGKAGTIMLQPSPCFGICATCPLFGKCNWNAIPQWESFSAQDKLDFEAELRRNHESYGMTHLFLQDFNTDACLEKALWLRDVSRRVSSNLRFVANLSLDNITRNPQILDALLEAGLVACNLDVVSLNPDNRRARGCLRLDPLSALHRLRAQASQDQLFIAAHLGAGLPHDSVDSLWTDVKTLMSPLGRGLVDQFNYSWQTVYKNSILGASGHYRFSSSDAQDHFGLAHWRGRHMTSEEAHKFDQDLQEYLQQSNFALAIWPTVDALLGTLNLGVDLATAKQFIRTGWGFNDAQKKAVRDSVASLADIYVNSYVDKVLGAALYKF